MPENGCLAARKPGIHNAGFLYFFESFQLPHLLLYLLDTDFSRCKNDSACQNRMQNLSYFIFIIFGVWLLTLSLFLYRFITLFNKLTKGVEVTDLRKVLEKVLAKGDANTDEIKALERKVDLIEEDGKFHIQKVGLIRFNPFKELGGDHSFSLAILDSHDSGIIITSLHTRDRTRVYMKDVKKGKSGFELSSEEKKALVNAQKSR